MFRHFRVMAIVAFGVFTFALCIPSYADDIADLKAQIALLAQQVEKLQAQQAQAVHHEEMKKLMGEMLQEAKTAPAMPKWMEGLAFYGDLRLRYQNDSYGPERNNTGGHGSTKSRNRLRTRLRFGVKKAWWDNQLEVGFRLSTGTTSASGNQTWGEGANDDFGLRASPWGKYYIGVDLAYAKYVPQWAKGLSLAGGKMKNPFRTRTMITWDSDINPEGILLDYAPQLANGAFVPFIQAGFWMLEEDVTYKGGRDDVTMWSFSTGFNWKFARDMKWFFGATFYCWDNLDAFANNGAVWWQNATAGTYRNNYKVLEMTTSLTWKMFNLPFEVWGSWVNNCADDFNSEYLTSSQGNGATGKEFEGRNNAFGLGFKVGQNKRKGDWSGGIEYLYIQQQATPAFNSGFGPGELDFGGPNRKGWAIAGQYNIDDFLTFGGKIYITEPIKDGWAGPGRSQVSTRIELIWKF